MKPKLSVNACTTTHIFCRPNCPPGRRTKPENRIEFISPVTAAAAGYRACKVCKPEDETLGGPGEPWKNAREKRAILQ